MSRSVFSSSFHFLWVMPKRRNVKSHVLTFNPSQLPSNYSCNCSHSTWANQLSLNSALFKTANILRSWLSGCSQLFGDLYDWFVFPVIFSARGKRGGGTHETQALIHRITQRFRASDLSIKPWGQKKLLQLYLPK